MITLAIVTMIAMLFFPRVLMAAIASLFYLFGVCVWLFLIFGAVAFVQSVI